MVGGAIKVIEDSGLNSPEVVLGYRTAFDKISATVMVLGSITDTSPSEIIGLVLNDEVDTDNFYTDFLNLRVMFTFSY
jgi:hypothetical protein